MSGCLQTADRVFELSDPNPTANFAGSSREEPFLTTQTARGRRRATGPAPEPRPGRRLMAERPRDAHRDERRRRRSSVPPGNGLRRRQRRGAKGRHRTGRHWPGPHGDGPRHQPRDGHDSAGIRRGFCCRSAGRHRCRRREGRLQPHGCHHQGRPRRQAQAVAERAVRGQHHPCGLCRNTRRPAGPDGHGLALRLPCEPHHRRSRGSSTAARITPPSAAPASMPPPAAP